MKAVLLLVVCLIAAVCAAPLTSNQYEFLFTKFVQQYNKQYETNDFFSRFNTFKSNLDLILAHNAQNLSWKMGVNQFADLSASEFSQIMGLRKQVEHPHIASKNTQKFVPNLKYSDIDWRAQGKVQSIKNQGQCGSCWAFSATTALETAVAIKTGTLYDLAEQQLVDCDDSSYGCNGGLMSNAYEYLMKVGGQCLTKDYPYTAYDGQCKDSSCNKVAVPTGYDNIDTSDDAHYAALQKGSVSVALAASSSAFQFYASGVLTSCSDRQIDHGVALVGNGSDNGTDYYILRNSWGTSWGEQGYMRIASGKSLCGLTTSTFDVQPTV